MDELILCPFDKFKRLAFSIVIIDAAMSWNVSNKSKIKAEK